MRRFEFVEGTSAKFWMAEVQGRTFIVVYGRLGTDGQRKEKEFPDAAGAQREYEKKVAEKLREGYHEVSAEGAPAPAPAASPKLTLPPRVRPVKATTEQLARATEALTALQSELGGRSWKVALRARRARSALRALGGVDPSPRGGLGPVVDALMAQVVAPRGQPRLPLWAAMGLLAELDAAAFVRALAQWKRAPTDVPVHAAVQVLARQAETLGEPELALRTGALLAERPGAGSGSEERWAERWRALQPHLEGHLLASGSSLVAWLRGLEAGGDARLAGRLALLGA
jgi:predicted DNA-binding WGR domain protein